MISAAIVELGGYVLDSTVESDWVIVVLSIAVCYLV
jgi:hypothetical protein